MDVGLVVGPWGMSFDDFVAAIREAEALGFTSFYAGDHFFVGPQLDSPDPYLLFALAARETTRIAFGPLVTPVMFRTPVELARFGAQLDILSGRRFVMGVGAGWQELEHRTYGIDYPSLRERFDRLDEALEVMRALWSGGPVTHQGRYYRLEGADCRPRPAPTRPRVLIGGGGERRTLALVAKHAGEWSAPGLSPGQLRHKRAVLAGHCSAIGRDPAEIRISMLSMGPIGATQADIDAATQQQYDRTPPAQPMSLAAYRQSLKEQGGIVGGPGEIVDRLGELAAAGVHEALFVYAPGVPAFLASHVLPSATRL
jgi:alkanesulfonate monooxygenase SsuD/methylene tetrahydromethanopterin reductase-like flavin-dependent oxidoreductase (luciferase family)